MTEKNSLLDRNVVEKVVHELTFQHYFMNYVEESAEICRENDSIALQLYAEYGVNRGLRDEKGNGVLTGLT